MNRNEFLLNKGILRDVNEKLRSQPTEVRDGSVGTPLSSFK